MKCPKSAHIGRVSILPLLLIMTALVQIVLAQPAKPAEKPDFPPSDVILQDYAKVISTADGKESLLTIWTREKDGQMLGMLPRGYDRKRFFIALTLASGDDYAGLQSGDMYVYWRRYDKRLALMAPNLDIKSTGDQESKDSVKQLYTDSIILDVPIVTTVGGLPVIDLDDLLVNRASTFFGSQVRVSNPKLIKIAEAKAFPGNVELAFEVPTARGQLQILHYSISEIAGSSSYRPRKADERIGYFTTSFSDYGKYTEKETRVRYVNRWNLQKADASLQLSPPKEPIVFYIEHTTPVRYRRWIREGILNWNKAFEKVGISNAIEVYYQDSRSGAHMEKDPEDVRYNFVRWLTNNQGTAIGPSRTNPLTGQILDADIILTDGWIRHYWQTFHEIMPQIMMDGMNPQDLVWLAENPHWDPRLLMAEPGQKQAIQKQIQDQMGKPYGGHPAAQVDGHLIGDDAYDGLSGRTSQLNGMCNLCQYRAMDVGLFAMALSIAEQAEAAKDRDPNSPKPKTLNEPKIDGIPESFIGPLMSDLVCHEVGHTLGLRHNFKASSVYTLKEVNSDEVKGKIPFAGSVMDYLPVNIYAFVGQNQGDYGMIGIGPYDEWAIEYGYTENDKDLEKIVARVAEPTLAFATDEDTWGPDPLARRYDFTADPLEYCNQQKLIWEHNRSRIIDQFVKDGESWAQARRAYEMTLGLQMRAVSMMSNWIGGAFVYRDRKGDKNARLPIEPVPAKQQRDAIAFVIENTFRDEALGLTPDLLRRMTVDKWWDDQDSVMSDPAWPVHDRIMGLQVSVLVNMMYPSTLARVYDNEFLVPAEEDALTLSEFMDTLTNEIFSELKTKPAEKYSEREPYISSLRRNLQSRYVELLISRSTSSLNSNTASKTISDLVLEHLRDISNRIAVIPMDQLDAYSRAHLKDTLMTIKKAIDSQYIQVM
ncbi:MAG: zinc-dependent metalloprotease [Phycisphaerae bacterium]|nr:zinc-dependent metalloprotease [Phycisphaerae bacterium]